MTDPRRTEEVEAFLERVRRCGPGLGSITLATRIDDLPRDKVTRTAVWALIDELLPAAEPGLIATIDTLGELLGWQGARTVAVAESGPGGTDVVPGPRPRVRLRPLRDGDLDSLYLASTEIDRGYRWRYRGATPSPVEFHGQVHAGVLVQYVVEGVADGRSFGLVSAYDARMEQGCASIALVRTNPAPGRGEVLEGLLVLIDHLFATWPLRKLYAEIPGFNAGDLLDPDDPIVRIEGRLVGHCYAEGRWWDQLILAIWRERWLAERNRWPFLGPFPGADDGSTGSD